MKRARSLSEQERTSPAPHPHQVAFFDLDHTLIKGNCSALFGAYLLKTKHTGFAKTAFLLALYAFHKCKILSLSRLHQLSFQLLFKGKNKETFRSLVKDHVQNVFHGQIASGTQHYFAEAKSAGDVYIVSASPDFIVEAYAEMFQVRGFYATEYCANDDGEFTHVGDVVDGHAKWEFAKSIIGGRRSIAYSDDKVDLPLLDNVDVGVLVERK